MFKYLSSTIITAVFCILFSLSSCKKKDPEPINEEELITTLRMTFSPEGGGSNIIFQWKDIDGDGGNDPVLMQPALKENTVYNTTITLLNESESPVEDVTQEIRRELESHQFFFIIPSTLKLDVRYNDRDSNNNPIGLSSVFTTREASTGILQVILRHEPNKSASGVSTGDVSDAGGETDIEVDFNVQIRN